MAEPTDKQAATTFISIGIIAWNEEKAIGPALESFFRQSFLGGLSQRSLRCELICVANGCTDRTSAIATEVFAEQSRRHPYRNSFSCRSVELEERGKANAWNQFVHSLSAREAQFLFLMDADILINEKETLWNMLATLEENPGASIATDRPCKSIAFKQNKSWLERLSLVASRMTQAAEAQLCGQLYCIRAGIARRIYLPRNLGSCDDGFIKTIVCTDFLTHKSNPARIMMAKEASHTFDAYTSIRSLMKNQKRQMIGQTIVHILLDDYMLKWSPAERMNLAEIIMEKERADPSWLKRLIGNHVRRTKCFWKLFPGIAVYRFKRLARLKGARKVTYFPMAVTGCFVSMISCFMAYGNLKQGYVDYWPHAKSSGPE